MSLCTDAECLKLNPHKLAEKQLDFNVLRKIERDLEPYEKFSIMLLMIKDYSQAFPFVRSLYEEHKNGNNQILYKFIETHCDNWKIKLLESLGIIKNFKVLRKVGVPLKEFEFLWKIRTISISVNKVAKCLYILLESLNENQMRRLIDLVFEDLKLKDCDFEFLELHVLFWMHQNYISVISDKEANLRNLLKHLKKMDLMDNIYMDLEGFHNESDTKSKRSTSDNSGQQNCSIGSYRDDDGNHHQLVGNNKINSISNSVMPYYEIKKGVCIIFNQEIFASMEYKSREGTIRDTEQLKETFESFNFDVHIFKDSCKCDVLNVLNEIHTYVQNDHDCVFVCILSHGSDGHFVTTDCEDIPLTLIEEKLCCHQLRNVIKIVIVQACQGKITGCFNSELENDGLQMEVNDVRDITSRRDFCMFLSTMPQLISVRHKSDGTWFIQEFCKVIQEYGKKRVPLTDCFMKIIDCVQNKRGVLGSTVVGQIPEMKPCRLSKRIIMPQVEGNSRY